jgi:hypothetical protein
VVRWYPPYSNDYKDQPIHYSREAKAMVDWFRSIGVKAEIVELKTKEVTYDY